MIKKTLFVSAATFGFFCVSANAEAAVFSMSELVSSDTSGTGVEDVSSKYADSTVYSFSGEGGITGINNDPLLSAVQGTTGYLTIAAWINPTAVDEVAIFSVGGQEDGFKFSLKGGKLQFTSKGVADSTTSALASVSTNEWTLVSINIALDGTSGSYFYCGEDSSASWDLGTWTSTSSPWNELTVETFGIGTGNSDGSRDPYSGLIADLTIITSDTRLSVEDVAEQMGAAPVAALPEPSAFGLLAGLGALAFVAARRRRSRRAA